MTTIQVIQIMSACYVLLIAAIGVLSLLAGGSARINGLPAAAGFVATIICAVSVLALV